MTRVGENTCAMQATATPGAYLNSVHMLLAGNVEKQEENIQFDTTK